MREADKKGSEAQRRVLAIIQLLPGRFYNGIGNQELAAELGTSKATVCRDMQVLEAEGWAEQREDRRWYGTRKLMQVCQAFWNHFENMRQRLDEDAYNIKTGARRYME